MWAFSRLLLGVFWIFFRFWFLFLLSVVHRNSAFSWRLTGTEWILKCPSTSQLVSQKRCESHSPNSYSHFMTQAIFTSSSCSLLSCCVLVFPLFNEVMLSEWNYLRFCFPYLKVKCWWLKFSLLLISVYCHWHWHLFDSKAKQCWAWLVLGWVFVSVSMCFNESQRL